MTSIIMKIHKKGVKDMRPQGTRSSEDGIGDFADKYLWKLDRRGGGAFKDFLLSFCKRRYV